MFPKMPILIKKVTHIQWIRVVNLTVVAALLVSMIPLRAFATTPPLNLAPKLTIKNKDNTNCTEYDISQNWSQYITDPSYWSDGSAGLHGMSSSNTTLAQQRASDFQIALQSGAWTIYQSNDNHDSHAIVLFAKDKTTYNVTQQTGGYMQINTLPGHTANDVWLTIIDTEVGNYTGGCTPLAISHSQFFHPDSSITDTRVGFSQWFCGLSSVPCFLSANAPTSYQSDYTGVHFPDHYTPKYDVRPEVDYSVADKKITANYQGNLKNARYIDWQLNAIDSSNNIVSPPITNTSGSSFEYTVSTYAKYQITAVAHFVPNVVPESYILHPTFITVDVNGTSFSGTTSDGNCGITETCAYTDYEKCDTFDIACHIRNIGVLFRNMMIELFLPNGDNTNAKFGELSDFFQQKFGFLLFPFTFLGNVFNSFTCGSSCSSGTVHISGFFGKTVDLNFLGIADDSPTAWTTFTTIIQAVTVVGIVLMFHRKFDGVIKQS